MSIKSTRCEFKHICTNSKHLWVQLQLFSLRPSGWNCPLLLCWSGAKHKLVKPQHKTQNYKLHNQVDLIWLCKRVFFAYLHRDKTPFSGPDGHHFRLTGSEGSSLGAGGQRVCASFASLSSAGSHVCFRVATAGFYCEQGLIKARGELIPGTSTSDIIEPLSCSKWKTPHLL